MSSLDDENTELLMNLLRKINHENEVTIVMTTTDLYKKLPTNTDYFLKNGKLSEVT